MDPLPVYSPAGDFATRRPEIALTTSEIVDFYEEVNSTNDDFIVTEELQIRLEKVYADLLGRSGLLTDASKEQEGLRAFLQDLVPKDKTTLTLAEFVSVVRSWNVPSQLQTNVDVETELQLAKVKMPWHRRLQYCWAISGRKISFVTFVVALQFSFGLYYLVRYERKSEVHAAMGYGVVGAKVCAGVLYPTIFFLLFSMSRWAMTWMRRVLPLADFINWDRSRSFHIYMAMTATIFGSVHAICHMAGSFVAASDPDNRAAVRIVFHLPPSAPEPTYKDFMRLRPVWTGFLSLLLFYTIGALAHPRVRRWNYEIFQYSHLLMFPLIGLLCAHGTLALLQKPILGWWILGPLILIVLERGARFAKAFMPIVGHFKVLDSEAVMLEVKNPHDKPWKYEAGQFVFLNVPSLSKFQWHPFTVSSCQDCILQLTIKTDGNWTKQLRRLPRLVNVAIDGPYGAPSQRFYEFDRSIIIGAGVGVTPFSAILTDMEQHLSKSLDPWAKKSQCCSRSGTVSTKSTRLASCASTEDLSLPSLADLKKHGEVQFGGFPNPNGSKSMDAGRKSILLRPRSPPKSKDKPLPRLPLNASKTFDSELPSSTAGFNVSSSLHSEKSHTSFKKYRSEKDIYDKPLSRSNTFDTIRPRSIPKNRVDFHWLVRSTSTITWFSSLLNRAHDMSLSIPPDLLRLNITPHITSAGPKPLSTLASGSDVAKANPVSRHIFRYLLDSYRTESSPVSLLSGLKSRSEFGRPDFRAILEQFGREVLAEIAERKRLKDNPVPGEIHIQGQSRWVNEARKINDNTINTTRRSGKGGARKGQKIGVFFCGAPVIGQTLKRECARLNRRAAERNEGIIWEFLGEVFG